MKERKINGEIIVVNDGSVDGTEEILERLRAEMAEACHGERSRTMTDTMLFLDYARNDTVGFRIITHPKNLGYGAAVRSGCDAAKHEWIAFMDSDGQFDPRDFDKLLPWCSLPLGGRVRERGSEENFFTPSPQSSPQGRGGCKGHSFDVVVGRRRKRADPFLRTLNAKLFGLLSWVILGIWVRDINCAMKVFRRSAWKQGRPTVTTGALFNAELFHNLRQSGIRWYQVDVSHYPRRAGRQTGANPKVILMMFRELWQLKTRRT